MDCIRNSCEYRLEVQAIARDPGSIYSLERGMDAEISEWVVFNLEVGDIRNRFIMIYDLASWNLVLEGKLDKKVYYYLLSYFPRPGMIPVTVTYEHFYPPNHFSYFHNQWSLY